MLFQQGMVICPCQKRPKVGDLIDYHDHDVDWWITVKILDVDEDEVFIAGHTYSTLMWVSMESDDLRLSGHHITVAGNTLRSWVVIPDTWLEIKFEDINEGDILIGMPHGCGTWDIDLILDPHNEKNDIVKFGKVACKENGRISLHFSNYDHMDREAYSKMKWRSDRSWKCNDCDTRNYDMYCDGCTLPLFARRTW